MTQQSTHEEALDRLLRQDLTDPTVACELVRFCERRNMHQALVDRIQDPHTIARLAWLANAHWPIQQAAITPTDGTTTSQESNPLDIAKAKARAAHFWFQDLVDGILPYTLSIEPKNPDQQHTPGAIPSVTHIPHTSPLDPSKVLPLLDHLSLLAPGPPGPEIHLIGGRSLYLSTIPDPKDERPLYDLIISPVYPHRPDINPTDHTQVIKLRFSLTASITALALICPEPSGFLTYREQAVQHNPNTFSLLFHDTPDIQCIHNLAAALLCTRITATAHGITDKMQLKHLELNIPPPILSIPWTKHTTQLRLPNGETIPPPSALWHRIGTFLTAPHTWLDPSIHEPLK